MPALLRPRQEECHKFEVSLDYRVIFLSQETKTKLNQTKQKQNQKQVLVESEYFLF